MGGVRAWSSVIGCRKGTRKMLGEGESERAEGATEMGGGTKNEGVGERKE